MPPRPIFQISDLQSAYICVIFLKNIGYKDINYDIPVCHDCHEGHEGHEGHKGHEGHESHEGLGTWYMSEWHSVLWTPFFITMYYELYGESTGTVL